MSEYRSYTEQMTVLDGDSDFRRCLKPSALFRYVEQVSADHARAYGMDPRLFQGAPQRIPRGQAGPQGLADAGPCGEDQPDHGL